MDLNKRTKIAGYVVFGAYSLLLFAFNVEAPSLLSRVASIIPLGVVGLFALYDSYLWHWKLLIRIGKTPDVRGTWRGKLVSYRRNAQDQRVTDERDVLLVVRQTFTRITITLISAESKSRSAAVSIVTKQTDDFAIQYQYQNEPRMSVRDRSPTHSGGATLEVTGLKPATMEGEYWTARDTRGTMSLARLSKRKRAISFDDGMRPDFGTKEGKS